jgi:hypothetical protein
VVRDRIGDGDSYIGQAGCGGMPTFRMNSDVYDTASLHNEDDWILHSGEWERSIACTKATMRRLEGHPYWPCGSLGVNRPAAVQ